MTKASEEFRQWIKSVDRTRNDEPYPFTDQERNLMATAFISGWHKGRTYKGGSMRYGVFSEYERQKNEMIGKAVVIQHPSIPEDVYEGQCVAISWEPVVFIRTSDGGEISRPVEWARLKEEV